MGMLAALGLVAAGVPPVGSAPAPGGSWTDVGMSAPFDPPAQRWQAGHRGVDLKAAKGDAVVAPHDGVVVFAGSVGGRPTVAIEVGGGWRTTLEPVTASVRKGQRVASGQKVGTVAGGGHCDGSCLHWGLRSGDGKEQVYKDPRMLVENREPSVLWVDLVTPPSW